MSIRIRLATEADAPSVLEIYAPIVQETHISFEYEVCRKRISPLNMRYLRRQKLLVASGESWSSIRGWLRNVRMV